MHLGLIRLDTAAVNRQVHLYLHGRVNRMFNQRQCPTDKIMHGNGIRLIFSAFGIGYKLTGKIRHPQGRLFHPPGMPKQVFFTGIDHLKQINVSGNSRQNIIELVGDTTGKA